MRAMPISIWTLGLIFGVACSSTTPPSCGSVSEISEILWEADSSRLSVADARAVFPNLTDYTDDSISKAIELAASDSLPDIILNLGAFRGSPGNNTRLFQHVTRRISSLYNELYGLYDYFNPLTRVREEHTEFKFVASQEFTNELIQRPVIQKLMEFLECRGNSDDDWLYLYDTLFKGYSRYGSGVFVEDSSAFENIFVGEFGREPHQALGLHNWYRLYWEERAGNLDLLGNIELTEPNILALPFLWSDHVQPSGSMFVGTSPDFEIALYMMCFYELPGQECNVSLGGHEVTIMTEVADWNYIGTAYPVVEVPESSINYMDLIPTTPPPTPPPDCGSLTEMAEKLWALDESSRLTFEDAMTLFPDLTEWTDSSIAQAISQSDPDVLPDIILNYHNNQSKLFQHIRDSKLSNDVYRHFQTLMGSYKPEAFSDDYSTEERRNQITDFLNVIMQTDVMKQLGSYVQCKKYAASEEDFKRVMDTIWFMGYYRYTEAFGLDSSGFENTFLGEYGENDKGVSGLHNWYRLYVLETAGDLDYTGFVGKLDPNVQSFTFDWDGRHQPQSSMWMGSSPEFEMAIYTLCYFEKPTYGCPVSLAGHLVSVMVDYNEYYEGQVWSAYPELTVLEPSTTSATTRTTTIPTTSPTTSTTAQMKTTFVTHDPPFVTTRFTTTTTMDRPLSTRLTTSIPADCPKGLYGSTCGEVCSMFCDGDGACDVHTGECNHGCKEGYGDKKCDIEVSDGFSGNKGPGLYVSSMTITLLPMTVLKNFAMRFFFT